ncbi:barstar family protein [Myceligenerans pegani]|uniref:Barstar family protein n=1 Tax=Myceligenerans pegani TaxID=2776917 RepID=A0ABR9N467_9MICO|nr:barstar family protein [Myceligenerans sp. TRM 65318]MBE1878461.1 barstar family protein [Myceligenerans sp. TRM 65318]MBE3020732.1 barstar family protein [Myceligenerans sp. TRM 65318]
MTDDLPVLVIDGTRFTDLDGFAREFSRLLSGYTWRGNLDALDDVLRGGYGTPAGGWVLRWVASETSRVALGHPETARRLERLLPRVDPSNRATFEARLEEARRGAGPTLFDEIVAVIRDHGPGGRESADGIVLELR